MFELITFASLMVIGFLFGTAREKRHYSDILRREKLLLNFPVRSETRQEFHADAAFLVKGNVVIASDYFKTFVANLRNFFGGRLTTYESLMDRARREAILRMKEEAREKGAAEIVGFRIEMVTVAQVGVEILAYGTALRDGAALRGPTGSRFDAELLGR